MVAPFDPWLRAAVIGSHFGGEQVAATHGTTSRHGQHQPACRRLHQSDLETRGRESLETYPDSSRTREKFLVFFGLADSARRMIRGGFLTEEDRGKLVALVRDGSAASRVTRRANALVLLDGGWSCQEVSAALLMDDDTIRGWHKLFEQRGIEGLTSFDMGGSAGFLSTAQEDA